MNPGTFYLYEYENYKRRRNVGFIKVSRHYQSCILQIHARGIPVRTGSTLNLYAFFCDHDQMVTSQIAELNSCGRNISIRLPVSETHFPGMRSLQQIDGFLRSDFVGYGAAGKYVEFADFYDGFIHGKRVFCKIRRYSVIILVVIDIYRCRRECLLVIEPEY